MKILPTQIMRASCLFLLALPYWLWGQSRLTLAAVQAQARGESPAARQADLTKQAAQAQYQVFQAGLRPQLQLGASVPGFTRSINGVQQDDGSTSFRTQNQTFSSANLSMRQVLPFSGGEITLFSALTNFNSFGPNSFTSWQSVPLGLRLRQPLFQVNAVKWDRAAASLGLTLAEREGLRQRETAVVEATRLFFAALVAQEQLRRLQADLPRLDSVYRLAQQRQALGRISEAERLQSELARWQARADSGEWALNEAQARADLALWLGQAPDSLARLPVPAAPRLAEGAEAWLPQAWAQSEQAIDAQLTRLQAERAVQEAKAKGRFQAELTASFGLNQTGQQIGEAYRNLEDQQAVSLSMQVPLLSWGRGRAAVDAAAARQRSTQLDGRQQRQQYEQDLRFQWRRVRQLQAQLSLAERVWSAAQRRYRISYQRHRSGGLALTDLYLARQDEAQAQVDYLRTLERLWLTLAEWQALALYDGQAGRPFRP